MLFSGLYRDSGNAWRRLAPYEAEKRERRRLRPPSSITVKGDSWTMFPVRRAFLLALEPRNASGATPVRKAFRIHRRPRGPKPADNWFCQVAHLAARDHSGCSSGRVRSPRTNAAQP